jgi:hypothetical protein
MCSGSSIPVPKSCLWYLLIALKSEQILNECAENCKSRKEKLNIDVASISEK